MRICFFANHGKTLFFRAVAQDLQLAGHTIFWIAPGRRWARALAADYSTNHVLDLTTGADRWRRSRTSTRPNMAIDGPLNEVSVVLADRFLREGPLDMAGRYVNVVGGMTADFARRNRIDVVLGEQTYASELSAANALLGCGIRYLVPATVRIPSNRFALFPAPFQARWLGARSPTAQDERDAGDCLTTFLRQQPRPYYYERNQGSIHPDLSWAFSPWKQVRLQFADPHELNRPTLPWLLKHRTTQALNGYLDRLYPFARLDPTSVGSYVLYALHRQPEASIDVLGHRLSDQLMVIRAVAQALPPGWSLVVKEHSNGLGDRSVRFYHGVARIPRVVLLQPAADARSWARHAKLTVTISGTLAYEAGLMGYPAATLVPMFFDPVLTASGVQVFDGSLSLLLRSLPAMPPGRTGAPSSARPFLALLFANSRPGIIGSPEDTPESMEADNVAKVAAGLIELLNV